MIRRILDFITGKTYRDLKNELKASRAIAKGLQEACDSLTSDLKIVRGSLNVERVYSATLERNLLDTTPKVVINVSGGLITNVCADRKVEILQLDYDLDENNHPHVLDLEAWKKDPKQEAHPASVSYHLEDDPSDLDPFFKYVEKQVLDHEQA